MERGTYRAKVLEWALLSAAILLAVAFAATAIYSAYLYEWLRWVNQDYGYRPPGRYSLIAAICFILSAAAIAGYALTVRRRKPRSHRWAIPTGILGGLVVVVAMITVPLTMFTGLLSDVVHKELPGGYVLIAVDTKEQLSIDYEDPDSAGLLHGIGIGPVVVDVGWNDHYIVATDRPPSYPGWKLSYYYIDLDHDAPPDELDRAVTGPLTEEEFQQAKSALGLPEFSLHFSDLR